MRIPHVSCSDCHLDQIISFLERYRMLSLKLWHFYFVLRSVLGVRLKAEQDQAKGLKTQSL